MSRRAAHGRQILMGLTALAALCLAAPAEAQESGVFITPPRTISDITSILDQDKPDPARRAKIEADAAAQAPAGASRQILAQFYYKRSRSLADLGRHQDAIADIRQATDNSTDYLTEGSRFDLFLERQLRTLGEYSQAIAVLEQMSRKLDALPRTKGRQFNINRRMTVNYLSLGDIGRAESYVKKNQALFSEARSWPNIELYRSSFESNVENAKARVLEARGRYAEAEVAYQRFLALDRDAMAKSKSWPSPPEPGGFEASIDFGLASLGRVKADQGRVVEAESDVRRALLSRLKTVGKYNGDTAQIIESLAGVLIDQSRYTEVEKLALTNLEIYEALGYAQDSVHRVRSLYRLGVALFAQRRYNDAKVQFALIDTATRGWPPRRSTGFRTSWSRVFVEYYTRNVEAGVELAREHLAFQRDKKGDQHYDTAMARAALASGLTYARRDAEALVEFQLAMPILLNRVRDDEEGDATARLSADNRLLAVAEANIALLARASDAKSAAIESLQVAEAVRGRNVQNALEASAARSAAKTPALAELVRKEQDLAKQAVALVGIVNNMLSMPPGERDDTILRAQQMELAGLRKDQVAAKREIERRFPEYDKLVNPKPVFVDEMRTALRTDEVLLSFHFGRRESFAWVVPKDGPVVFAALPTNISDIDKRIKELRKSLEPNASTVGDIPPFDLKAAHDLYNLLLKPIEAGWRPAKNLIVATNGALGLLPLGLLPVEPTLVKADAEPYFSEYRKVAWLARTHAVTMIPSASALRTLRQIPTATAKRDSMIGFGDPFFNRDQEKEAATEDGVRVASVTTRGLPIKLRAASRTADRDSAEIGQLPRLPDTADELKSIATALEADPAKVLHLGKSANEKIVKGLDLSHYRVIVFATHGLVPGEINGLMQPALALTAPNVADVDGDGLLTVDEILGLRLNADWVVLSACNTAAGAGAGAEAASGLGRAFFYAGTRSLLVTNWSVHSASARELVTELFRRQAAGASMTRAEALRQASMALIDGPGFADESGKTLFTYAHPLFWAPYSILGDGGAG